MADFEPIEFAIESEIRDYREAYAAMHPYIRTALMLSLAFIVLGVLVLRTGGYDFLSGALLAACLVTGLRYFWLWYRLSYVVPANVMRAHARLAPQRYRFTSDALELTTRLGTSSTSWAAFTKCFEGARVFVITSPSLAFYIIPKRNIPPDLVADFRRVLVERISSQK